jgi:hypothetical protein
MCVTPGAKTVFIALVQFEFDYFLLKERQSAPKDKIQEKALWQNPCVVPFRSSAVAIAQRKKARVCANLAPH